MAAEFAAIKVAEVILSQVVLRISDLLTDEATSLRDVKDDIESLKNELKYMNSILKNGDPKEGQDELVRTWVAEVKEIAYEITDFIETYIYKVHSSYIKMFHFRKIDYINAKLKGIHNRRERYQIDCSKRDGTKTFDLKNLRKTNPADNEDHDVITLEESTANLKKKLIAEEDQCCIVSIVGMGGLGKTTLAKKVFNDVDVRKCFDCHAWVFISQQYVPREVLTEILLQVCFQNIRDEGREFGRGENIKESLGELTTNRDFLNGLKEHDLVNLMKSELKNKRYLIVLDDIWDIEFWSSMKRVLPNGRSGSKVLFTTRNCTVAYSVDYRSSIIRLPLLTPEESLKLLKGIVFPRRETFLTSGCPSEYETLGKEMLKKCGGLPLAIVLLGGLLRKNNSLEEWKKVLKDVERPQFMINRLESHQELRDIFELSFQDLPYHLKQCFLYMGSFPKDSEIHKSMLVRLWIAEGFVSRTELKDADKTIEDVAERFLEELIDRCMVQVEKKNHTGNGVKTCRLHDLMQDFCFSKAKKENMFVIIGKDQMITIHSSLAEYSVEHRSRRFVAHGLDHFPWMEQLHPNSWSFLLFGGDYFPTISSRVKNFRLLKVLALDLVGERILEKNLKGIGSLILLRYLRLTASGQTELIIPRSIGNLRNLQTLDIRGACNEAYLPQSLARLKHLRHLLLPISYYFRRHTLWTIRSPLFGMSSLRVIETLKGVRARDLIINGKIIFLFSIRKLGITDFRSAAEVSLVLESLKHRLGVLRYLGMELLFGDFPSLKILSHCLDLTSLRLKGNLSIENFSFLPQSLVKLKLWNCLFDQDKFTVLEKLPNIRILQLESLVGGDGYKWVCSANGFRKLEILILEGLSSLEEWEVEEGSLPTLTRLDIILLSGLRMIPEGLKHVNTLRELNVRNMSTEFVNSVRRVYEDGTEGADYYIPSITFSDTV